MPCAAPVTTATLAVDDMAVTLGAPTPLAGCDVPQRANGGAGDPGRQRRGGQAGSLRGEMDSQRARRDPEPERRVELERLAVDAGRHPLRRAHLERLRRPL